MRDKALRDYIGTSEATILAVARPEFDAAYKQQRALSSQKVTSMQKEIDDLKKKIDELKHNTK